MIAEGDLISADGYRKSGGPCGVSQPPPLPSAQLFEYGNANASEEVFYPTYDLSDFSWDSINRTMNHTALTAELRGVPTSDSSGSFSNGSLAFRVRCRSGDPPARGSFHRRDAAPRRPAGPSL